MYDEDQKNNFKHIRCDFGQKGFSLVEVILVIGMLAILFSASFLSLSRVQHTSSLSSTVETFLSDFKNQQIKAMTGNTEGRPDTDNYSIYFDPAETKYILFHGNVYDPADTANVTVDLPPTIRITADAPNHTLIFLKGSGEIASCCNGVSFKITFKDTTNDTVQKTIDPDRYGAVEVY